jgi:hypothetical protein
MPDTVGADKVTDNADELNEFIDEVTDGAYSLSCVEVIFKLVKQIQAWGDERIKKIVAALAVKGIKIVLVDTVFPCVYMKVTDNASNIKKSFKFFDTGLQILRRRQE